MTSAKTYQWVLPHVFHAISRDVIRNFHTLFHTCAEIRTLFHTCAEIRTLFHTCCGNSHTVPHASTPYGTLSASLPMEVLFRMNSTLYGI